MKIELTLNEAPTGVNDVYWSAKLIHEGEVLMETQSAPFLVALDTDYKMWYERTCARMFKELKQSQWQSSIRELFLQEISST